MPRKEVLQKGNSPTVPVTSEETRRFYSGGMKSKAGLAQVEKALRDAEGADEEYKKGKNSGDLSSEPKFDFFKK